MAERRGVMTEKQRVEALLNRRKPDRVPIWGFPLGFAAVYTKAPIADIYNNPYVSLVAQRKTARDFGWVSMPYMGYAIFGAWEFGGDIKWPHSEFAQAPSVVRHPVQTPDDAMKLKVPNVKNSGMIPIMIEFNKAARQQRLEAEPFQVVFEIDGNFNTATNTTGLEKFAKWMLKRPDVVHRLLRLSTDYLIDLAEYVKNTFGTGRALLFRGEPTSSNYLISPKQFEEFALPYLKETNKKLLAMGYKHIFMHICGDHNANLACWAQIPMGDPGFISIGHEVDLETVAKYFPKDIIVGNIDPSIIQGSTAVEVYEASRRVIEKGKELPGGFMFAPGCELPPMAPLDNVMAMTKAANDFGWYN